jgi:hypothetical protein
VRALVFATALLLCGCLAPADDDGVPDAGAEAKRDPCSQTMTTNPEVVILSQEGCRCPWMDGCGAPPASANLTLAVNASIAGNATVGVTVSNAGGSTLTYDAARPCPVQAWTLAGRQVWMPCSTDRGDRKELAPGASVDLPWLAAKCLRASNGGYGIRCTAWQALPPGTYALRVVFDEAGLEIMGGMEAVVS